MAQKRKPILFRLFFAIYWIGLVVLFGSFKWLLYLVEIKRKIRAKLSFGDHPKPRLVIVGGGYAGTFIATQLEHDFEVTLLDMKEFFEFTPSRLRTISEPDHAHKVHLAFSRLFKSVKVIIDNVQEITQDSVITATRSIPFDYLVICTGSRVSDPAFVPKSVPSHTSTKMISAKNVNLQEHHALVDMATKILIIGGGIVGVEMAGEIIDTFTKKEITIVHAPAHLLQRSPDRVSQYAQRFLEAHNAKVFLGEKVIRYEDRTFTTDKGSKIDADLAIFCSGNVPNSEFLREGQFADKLDERGFIKVNNHLQMQGFKNIFVAGDVSNFPEEEKLCQTAGFQSNVVVQNLRNLLHHRPLKAYHASHCPILISLGKYEAVFTFFGWSFGGILPAMMKEFVEWKELIFYWDWNTILRYRPKPNPLMEKEFGRDV